MVSTKKREVKRKMVEFTKEYKDFLDELMEECEEDEE